MRVGRLARSWPATLADRRHRPRSVAVRPDLVQAVVEAIARGELDDELGVLGAVINERVRLLATARSMRTLASLRVGDRVRINHSAKPNYLHGQPGTVIGWAGQNVIVQLDRRLADLPAASCAARHSSSNHRRWGSE
jgi:hypothetical protein